MTKIIAEGVQSSNKITDDDSKGIQKDGSIKRAFFKTFEQFSSETPLHGVKYITRHNYESYDSKTARRVKIFFGNIFWIIAVKCGVILSIYLANLIWIRFQTTPTKTIIDTFNHPIWEVPFPAVTVCNTNKVYLPKTLKFRKLLLEHQMSNDTIDEFFGNISKMITFDYVDDSNVRVEYVLHQLGYDTDQLLLELMQPCADMLRNCSWLGQSIPCNHLFRMIKTFEGFCCSFNYKALKEQFDKNFDAYNMSMVKTPLEYVNGIGENNGLFVVVDTKQNECVSSTESYDGANVFLSHSNDLVDVSATTAILQPGEDLRLEVDPKITESPAVIRKLDVQQRNCLYDDELELLITNRYSFVSCMAECRGAHALAICHCMPFMYPLFKSKIETGYIRQCLMRDLFCLRPSRPVMSSLAKPGEPEENSTGMHCSCLPSCSTVLYTIDPNSGIMDGHVQESFLHVYFKDLTCVKYKREPYMYWDQLFAALGGIFGLCMGASVISAIELMYFFTFKFYTIFKMYKHDFLYKYVKKLWRTKTSRTSSAAAAASSNTSRKIINKKSSKTLKEQIPFAW